MKAPPRTEPGQVMVWVAVSSHIPGMSGDNETYPYTLAISPSERTPGHFDWAIRKHGKLVERSDRSYPSERSAQESGQAALERQFQTDREPARGFQSGRRNRTG